VRKETFIFLFLCCCFSGFSQEWKLKKDKNDIQVFIRKLDSASIYEYKAVLVANSTPEKALKVITDGNNLWKWNHQTSESKTIKKYSDKEFVFWMKNDFTWPVKSRDNVVKVHVLFQENDTIKIDLLPERSNLVPEKENCIRMTDFKGRWLIISKPENKIEVTQQLYGDPERNLPAWALNAMLTNAPYNTFLNLKELLEN